MKGSSDMTVGRYTGLVAERYRAPEFLAWLENIGPLVREAAGQARGRNLNVVLTFQRAGSNSELAVKSFGRQFPLKEWLNASRGSKARRTWHAAVFLHEKIAATPPPVAFLEDKRYGAPSESYFISEYQAGVSNFRDELVNIFRGEPDCGKLMSLMQCVAEAVRRLHEAGFLHNDLGNQNILLRRKGPTAWGDVMFVDLNRGRIKDVLTLEDRSRDLSRIYLPSDLLRIFKEMYFGDTPPPGEFQASEMFHRRMFALHTRTRNFRHPIRFFLNRASERAKIAYPSEKDMWIWDERSGQPISVMRPRDRARYRGVGSTARIAATTLGASLPVRGIYNSLLAGCFKSPVEMKDRIGVAIEPAPDTLDRQLDLLSRLGGIPVLVRLYHHHAANRRAFAIKAVRRLHEQGHRVSVALIQDRTAALNPASWTSFVAESLDQLADVAEYVEIGHAINRVKWGIWNMRDHRTLLEAAATARNRHPDVRFIGPAAIDFEYPFLMAALRNLPASLRFAALSHHLYVDRRGAPESAQGAFSTLEKCALARAICRWSGVCEDKFIVSETNWPLRGTGVFSPVTSPYESPGQRFNDPSVSEQDYADYMIRYLLIAVCSGMVDRVYWWRLVARGYGLVDDTDPSDWRERPAFTMLRHFLATLGQCAFVEKPRAEQGVHLYVFKSPSGARVCVAYSFPGERDIALPPGFSSAADMTGKPVASSPERFHLSGSPAILTSAP